MALVFLATDTRSGRQVALRLVSAREASDVLDAERRGAELQKQFCRVSAFVPEVYEHGTADGYLYVAMEYLDGENLSQAIRRGPLPEARAVGVAIELCRFLEDARGFTWKVEDREIRHLLHGDLTPANVRLTLDGRTKVLDFGIAKALSLSRKVTRNDFGSLAYLSPERLESGGDMDATDGFWAVGVMLYEMLRGAQPFGAPDTRRLERLIVARRPAPGLEGACAVGLQAVVAKLLAPTPAERYDSAIAIREDLERYQLGRETHAQQDGWPARAADEPATRRTRPTADAVDETTRRTVLPASALRASAGQAPSTVAAPPSAPTAKPRAGGALRSFRRAVLVVALILVANEIWVARAAGRTAATVPSRELDSLGTAWSEYHSLSWRSLGPGTWRLERSLRDRTTALTDRVMASYRDGLSIVWEPQWQSARASLASAAAAAPDREELLAALRYCEGHLHRINGDARKADKDPDAARREFGDAVVAFREAAELRPRWPDPFIGLSRTFLSGLGDVDRGADALKRAQQLGYTPGERETAQLAAGYRERGDTLARSARELAGMPQERDYLSRAAAAYQQALDLYSGIVTFGGVPASIRRTQAGMERAKNRLSEIDGSSFDFNLGPLGSLSIQTPGGDAR
jgi:serine/threonine-protein kinase